MSFYSRYRISKPSASRIPAEEAPAAFARCRRRTFWAVTAVYALYYVCRMVLGVVRQPLIDGGFFTVTEIGVIGMSFYIVYAFGKFVNGFLADYCNIRRFMALGIGLSAAVNIILGLLGIVSGGASVLLTLSFTVLWGLNGWLQSMGSPPGVIGITRWFPKNDRGVPYSIFSSTPYVGRFLTMVGIGFLVGAAGWQWGFVVAGAVGLLASVLALCFIQDTPESAGLPSVQEWYSEEPEKKEPTRSLQLGVLKHPGLWVIAFSSAFTYIAQHAVSDWGVLFLQKAKDFSLEQAAQTVGLSELFGVVGTVSAGFLSDKLFKGDRCIPVIIAGVLSTGALAVFLFTGGGTFLNMLWISIFSVAIGIIFCIVAGLMALDFVPRRAVGAAMGLVGISSYLAAGAQSLLSGFLLGASSASSAAVDGAAAGLDFTSAAIFWTISCALASILPVFGWKFLKK
ncbi:MAG: MFS transporter [Bacteroidales bacterium]|nr:MFS transporter [Bacteroidales bacterium]